MNDELLDAIKAMPRRIQGSSLSVSQFALASLMYLQIAEPYDDHDTCEAHYREWHLAHLEFGIDPPKPTDAHDDELSAPHGTLQAGLNAMLASGWAGYEKDGTVYILIERVVRH